MGRKKRKVDSSTDQVDELGVSESIDPPGDAENFEDELVVEPDAANDKKSVQLERVKTIVDDEANQNDTVKKVASSAYAMTSHSGELIQEDVYVSDGSQDSDDEEEMEIVLTSSRMGIMRRGLHHQMMALQQPNRQWKRQDGGTNTDEIAPANTATASENDDGTIMTPEQAEELKRKREEEELSQLDPAQRAARLLVEKQRREVEAKIEERRRENEENVMRDPTLFSKRTAFDIRFDQIDDKPWERGVGSSDNHSEFFNYGLSEEDWLEYAAQQLIIRQELIDAYRQKRVPDPAIVPIQPPVVKKEESSTESTTLKLDTGDVTTPASEDTNGSTVATSNEDVVQDNDVKMEEVETSNASAMIPAAAEPTDNVVILNAVDVAEGVGGAWGAGAAPGSFLARLIEEQELGASKDVKSTSVEVEKVEAHEERIPQEFDESESYRGKEYVKSEYDYGRNKRRGSGGEVDDASYNRDADDSSNFDSYDDPPSGRHWNRNAPPPPHHQGRFPPPPPPPPSANSSHRTDVYNSYSQPPPHGTGYQGRGGRGGGPDGGRGGGRFQPRGGGRGGRGYYNRDASSGRGDYYQEQQHSGWKRSRNEDDTSRRRY